MIIDIFIKIRVQKVSQELVIRVHHDKKIEVFAKIVVLNHEDNHDI